MTITRYAEVPANQRSAVEAALRAADVPSPPDFVGKALAKWIERNPPKEGELPIGHTRHYAITVDPDTGDVLVEARAELMDKVPALRGHVEERPSKFFRKEQDEDEAETREKPVEDGPVVRGK